MTDMIGNERYAAFEAQVRNFLAENLTGDLREAAARELSVTTSYELSRAWQAILYRQSWAAIYWPAQYGGTGWDVVEQFIFITECAAAGAPQLAPMSLRMAGPAIFQFGNDAQKSHYLPRILSGDDYWCQGFSEPGAGSDLAALQLRADIEGDELVLNGSKIWTTHAHHANRIFCLVRTTSADRRQKGISFLLCDMATPGISVKPIRFFSGDHEVNEVFFDDVRVPIANIVGEIDQGWAVAKFLLEFERGLDSPAAALSARLARLKSLAASRGLTLACGGASGLRHRLAMAEIDLRALQSIQSSVLQELAGGGRPGIASSLIKLIGADLQGRIGELGTEVAGGDGRRPARMASSTAGLVERHYNGRAQLIAGGTQEIQRDILARMVIPSTA